MTRVNRRLIEFLRTDVKELFEQMLASEDRQSFIKKYQKKIKKTTPKIKSRSKTMIGKDTDNREKTKSITSFLDEKRTRDYSA